MFLHARAILPSTFGLLGGHSNADVLEPEALDVRPPACLPKRRSRRPVHDPPPPPPPPAAPPRGRSFKPSFRANANAGSIVDADFGRTPLGAQLAPAAARRARLPRASRTPAEPFLQPPSGARRMPVVKPACPNSSIETGRRPDHHEALPAPVEPSELPLAREVACLREPGNRPSRTVGCPVAKQDRSGPLAPRRPPERVVSTHVGGRGPSSNVPDRPPASNAPGRRRCCDLLPGIAWIVSRDTTRACRSAFGGSQTVGIGQCASWWLRPFAERAALMARSRSTVQSPPTSMALDRPRP